MKKIKFIDGCIKFMTVDKFQWGNRLEKLLLKIIEEE